MPTAGTVHAADETRLNVVIAGPRRPRAAVVLVHGFCMATPFWEAQIEALSQEFLVIAYDQRGHGASGRPGIDGFELETLGADLQAVIDALVPAAMPVVACGHSMGGMAVMGWATYAQRNPARLDGAVLLNTTMHHVIEGVVHFLPARLVHPFTHVVWPVLSTPVPIHEPVRSVVRAVLGPLAHGPGHTAAGVERTMALVRATPPRGRAAAARFLERVDARAAVSGLDIPTLVIAGGSDHLTPAARSAEIAQLAPRARLEVLHRQGHQAPIDAPEQINDLIRDFTLEVAAATARPRTQRRARAA
jgi:pimeloyl-ACP methyl ester carboxylesterase